MLVTWILVTEHMLFGAYACTAIGVGRLASASGATMIGHSEDSGPIANDVRLARVPRKKWAKNTLRPLYNVQAAYPRVVDASRSPDYAPFGDQQSPVPLGYIPQIAETFAYWDLDYAMQNEKGVSIGESTCDAKTVGWPADKSYGYNYAGIEELTKIALERCATARCAVETMGSIAVEQGFYSADSGEPDAPDYSGSSECLLVGDASPGEVWVFDIMTGKGNASAIWAAQRIPPDHVTAIANAFTIRKMNLSDSDNYLYSPGVTELAEEQGWWSPEEESSPEIFDFYKAYGYSALNDPSLTPWNATRLDSIFAYYVGRRIWRIFSLLSPSEGAKLDPNQGQLPTTPFDKLYPTSVPAPKGSVTLSMVQHTYRDHYEGTPYDLTQGMAAGPWGNPNRGHGPPTVAGQWERAISMYRTSWSFVLEGRPDGRSRAWFGWDAPHGTAYLPFYASATESAPTNFRAHGSMAKFSTDMAWWAFNLVNQYQDINFKLINAEVRLKSGRIEDEGRAKVAEWEKKADSMDEHAAISYLTAESNRFAEEKVAEWWEFAWSLIAKYRGFVITYNQTMEGTDANGQLYPEWWLESPEVGYSIWSHTGPFHGVLLSAMEQPKLPMLLSTFPSMSSAFLPYLTSFVVMICVAYLSHQAGLRQGRRDAIRVDSHYLLLG